MSMRPGWICVVAVLACGGSSQQARLTAHSGKQAAKETQDDGSRCEYRGRADREISESVAAGALQPNIRRVYRVSGQGELRRRIIACREVDTNLDGVKDVFRHYSEEGQPLQEEADTNYDGQVDTWTGFSKGRIAKVEVDEDQDGRPDVARYYMKGKLMRVQRDTNSDQKPDIWEIYGKGRLQRMGVDLDFDGRVDRWNRGPEAEAEDSEADEG